MINEKLYMIELRVAEGCLIKNIISGDDNFFPALPQHEWKTFVVFCKDKNEGIDKIIEKLKEFYVKEIK